MTKKLIYNKPEIVKQYSHNMILDTHKAEKYEDRIRGRYNIILFQLKTIWKYIRQGRKITIINRLKDLYPMNSESVYALTQLYHILLFKYFHKISDSQSWRMEDFIDPLQCRNEKAKKLFIKKLDCISKPYIVNDFSILEENVNDYIDQFLSQDYEHEFTKYQSLENALDTKRFLDNNCNRQFYTFT